MSKLKLAIIFGGNSSEYAISLRSATSIIREINKEKYELTLIGITKTGSWLSFCGDTELIEKDQWCDQKYCSPCFLSPDPSVKGFIQTMSDGTFTIKNVDVIFPVLHGQNGEDGTIQGLFTLSQIPYVGCDTISSANCMDKVITNTLMDYNNINHTKWCFLNNSISFENIENLEKEAKSIVGKLGEFPFFVKPANAGSSVGVSKVSSITELTEGIKLAFTVDSKVLIEKGVDGREVEIAVMGNDYPVSSVVGEVVTTSELYSYDAKYVDNTSTTVIPANLPESLSDKLRQEAVFAYKTFGCSGLARVDFFVENGTDKILLNEINTLPGFTSISMYPKLFMALGLSYSELIDKLIDFALQKRYGLNE